MEQNDYNIIKPIDSLSTFGQLGPVKRREERTAKDHRQKSRRHDREKTDEQVEEQLFGPTDGDDEPGHVIDYRA